MTRADAVALVADALASDWLAIACNGMISRELFAHTDAPTRFYMVGSMGLASSIGLGVAIVQPARTVVVFDGDGNVLMNMSALGSVAAAAPRNLYHVVFDNGSHESTGGQATISNRVPIEEVAAAAGYRSAVRVADDGTLAGVLRTFFAEPGPAMLLITVERGNQPGIGRVTVEPRQLAARFRAAATGR
jgi:thiamine pyrophosphate-dependent acetolactate synthase large subunit-like protein